MLSPKGLILQLYRNWEIIEELATLSREYPAFELDLLVRVISQYKQEECDTNTVLSRLVHNDILQPMRRTSDYQLNPLVMDFVRGLTQENELGLSEVLRARVEAIKEATAQILKGLESADNDLLRMGAQKMAELTRKISQQLVQDKQAIFEIAELARSADINMPMERRYREVFEVYDQYVEPMNEMMDCGLGGRFYPLLESAERALDKVVDRLSIRGSIYQQQLMMRQIAYQVKDLRYLGRITAQQCADTLLPLREEGRQHNRLSSVISKQISQIRKKGLQRGLRREGLPVWQNRRCTRVQLGNEIRELMGEFMCFESIAHLFPEEKNLPDSQIIRWVDENELHNTLMKSLPVHNLMIWLKLHYPALPDAELLRLYHDLVRGTDWECRLSAESNTTALESISVTYHPHALSISSLKDPNKEDDNEKESH